MNPQIVYRGEWTLDGCRVFRNDLPFSAERSQKLHNHSPEGFAWGYQGSGPAQLALALLYDALRDSSFAFEHYQAFKREVVSRWPVNGPWRITQLDILRWISAQLADSCLN